MTRVALVVRTARVEDAPTLAAAQRAIAATPGLLVSNPSEIRDEALAAKIAALAGADEGRFVVGEVDGALVGHALLDPLPYAAVRHVTHLTMAVSVGWQGRGVGRALLGELIAWARANPSVEKIELHVRATNVAAQALYVAFGFREVGRWSRRVKVAPNHAVDDVAMELSVR
ncbi:MAG: GNAT family N-acetyltransferase [Sandaracinus sp.]|nr:GNAT family N-acetyltransferase [Sandaracinus sp.]MCB9611211.1 GNAT family N-acetyltransferase [Sandaracinus sp.]MCB9630863.1 GNAT family N-acetyltransferase [Sandaracinus sp.]